MSTTLNEATEVALAYERWCDETAYSVGLSASLQVFSGAAIVYGFSVTNTNAAGQWVLWFDKNGAIPADTTAPCGQVWVPGSSTVGVAWTPRGRRFKQGVWLCNSSTAATKTIGASDCWFDARYRRA